MKHMKMKSKLLGALTALLMFVVTSFAQTNQVFPFVTSSNATTGIAWTAGTVNNGGHPVAIVAGSSTINLNKTDCSAPLYALCNFVFANSAGTVAVTTSAATANASGNTLLAIIESGATTITQIVYPQQTSVANTGVQYGVQAAPTAMPATTAASAGFNLPAGTAPTAALAGDIYNDSTKKAIVMSNIAANPLTISGTLQVLPAQTAITTVSTIQAMNSTAITIPAGALNVVGKMSRICGQFVFSNGATAPLITLSEKFGAVALAAPVSSANANTNSSSPGLFCFYTTTTATGASGTVESHGYLTENVASAVAGAAASTFPDTVTAVSSAIDLTAAITVTINMTVSSGPVTTATLRWATVELLN
jgi:hypothetical protein